MTKVLIVDDKEENLYMLESLLKGNGYSTISAINGAEALGLAQNELPDLIIADILMPVMDGYSLCRHCKKDEKLKKIPFVFYTATYTHPKDEEFALSLGADLFLVKPQEPDEFINKIQKVLNDFSSKRLNIREIPEINELEVYKEYNETLVRKMEDRMLQSEAAEKKIKDYAEQLVDEIKDKNIATIALKNSEEKYRAIFENSAIAILLTAPDGRIFSANIASCKMFGRTEEEICLVGRDGLVDKNDPRLPILLEERKKNGKAFGKVNLVRKDGSIFEAEISSVIFLDTEGNEKTSMVIHDLTEQKKAEKELMESKLLFQNLAEFSPLGIFQTRADGYTTYVNPKWSELSGLSFQEALGFGWLVAVHPDDKEQLIKNWHSDIEQQFISNSEYRFLKPDGKIIWVMGKAVPLYLNSTIAGYIGTIIDITDRKIAENELIALKEKLEDKVNEQTKELKLKVKELEEFREITLNREFRIAELRDEIKRLKGL